MISHSQIREKKFVNSVQRVTSEDSTLVLLILKEVSGFLAVMFPGKMPHNCIFGSICCTNTTMLISS